MRRFIAGMLISIGMLILLGVMIFFPAEDAVTAQPLYLLKDR